jgi:glycosyltransferase involved in cell wall biosynthesis
MQTGFKYAETCGYDAVIQMDGDGQHDPAYVAQLMAPLITGEADMVIGSRFLEQKSFRSTALRRTGIGILRAVIRLRTGRFITDPTSGLRAMNKRAYSMLARHYAQDYPEPESVVAALACGMRFNEIPVGMRARSGGVSSINPLRSVYYMLKVTLAVLLQGKYS